MLVRRLLRRFLRMLFLLLFFLTRRPGHFFSLYPRLRARR
jgi:hypothetical protein